MHPIKTWRSTRRAWLRAGLILTAAGALFTRAAAPVRAQAAPASNVYGWGGNDYGQLGNGTTTGRNTAGPAAAPADAVAVAAGSDHSLALKADGTVEAWGWNSYGQLGDGTQNNRLTPVPVRVPSDPSGFLTNVAGIAAGGLHCLALKGDGTAVAWGDNYYGELGDGTGTYYRSTPVPVRDPSDPSGFLTNVAGIAGGGVHSLATKNLPASPV